jgi:hypothetical protein
MTTMEVRRDTVFYTDPLMNEADVIGLYEPAQAAVVARGSMTDQGSGQWKWDD